MQENFSELKDHNMDFKKKNSLGANALFSLNPSYQSNIFQKSFLKEKLFSKSI
jgi:hypothetical protein